MPSQICHIIFAEEALKKALGSQAQEILERRGNIFRFGAQGPDFFYHNQRTRPSGLKYGTNAHREGFGRLVANMIAELRRLESRCHEELPRIRAYILGFSTHAVLDKKAHPFIDYYAGWKGSEQNETEDFFRCHIFLERILDVLMLKRKRGIDIGQLDLPSLLDCGPELPYGIVKTLVKALHVTYPKTHFKSRDRQRVQNAYSDTMAFYAIIDPRKPRHRRLAYERDLMSQENQRRLALFHLYKLPADIDFLNLEKRLWTHPCNNQWRSNESFPELYEAALEEAVPILTGISQILNGEVEPQQAEQLLGNQSLETGLYWREGNRLVFNDPLPLAQLIDELYLQFEQAPALNP